VTVEEALANHEPRFLFGDLVAEARDDVLTALATLVARSEAEHLAVALRAARDAAVHERERLSDEEAAAQIAADEEAAAQIAADVFPLGRDRSAARALSQCRTRLELMSQRITAIDQRLDALAAPPVADAAVLSAIGLKP
jgi:hypothetical protein